MREENSLIHGLELQGRALTAVTGDADNVAFLVGTQSLRHTNMVYRVVMDEESNQLAKRAFKHSMVEGWLWLRLMKHFHLVRRTYNSLIGHVLVHKVSCIFLLKNKFCLIYR